MQRLRLVAFVAALLAETADAYTVLPARRGALHTSASLHIAAVVRTSSLRLEEAAAAAPTAEADEDFTDDLLDALAADEAPLADEEEILDDTPLSEMISQPVFVKDDDAEVALVARTSFTNEVLVEEVCARGRLGRWLGRD